MKVIGKATKTLGVAAITLAVIGCSGGGSDDAGDVVLDDPLVLNGDSTTGATGGDGVTNGTASPVVSVTSAQMDSYVDNPLLASVPSELDGNATSGKSKMFITNPLLN